jgi:hypothetical protein
MQDRRTTERKQKRQLNRQGGGGAVAHRPLVDERRQKRGCQVERVEDEDDGRSQPQRPGRETAMHASERHGCAMPLVGFAERRSDA